MDALSQTLRVVRLVGAIFINAKFTAPWSYQSPKAATAAPLLEPGAERVVIFHLITEGECYVELADEPPMCLRAGDVVVFPQGDAHVMSSSPDVPPATRRPLGSSARATTASARLWRRRGDDAPWCAAISACDQLTRRKCCFAGLPALLQVNVRGSSAGIVARSPLLRYALAEARSPRPGGAGVLGEARRGALHRGAASLYERAEPSVESAGSRASGIASSVTALNAMHSRPARAWTSGRVGARRPGPQGRCSLSVLQNLVGRFLPCST